MAPLSGRSTVYLDRAVGETRALIMSRGRAQRLFVVREGAEPVQQAGARVRGRLAAAPKGSGLAFVELGAGPSAVVPASAATRFSLGSAVEVEILAEARADKGPTARLIRPVSGPPGLIAPAPSLSDRLSEPAPGAAVVEGAEAVDAIDAAVEEALDGTARTASGGLVTVEPTRALVAVDVDFADAAAFDARRGARRINLEALEEAARLMRLAGLGGLVVVDLIGTGHDGEAIRKAAEAAFAPDGPGVVIGPLTRFGTLQLTKPWRERPLAEVLLGPDRRPTALTAALDLLRRIEREGRADPGGRLHALCAPEVERAAAPLLPRLAERLGPRFTVEARADVPRERPQVRAG